MKKTSFMIYNGILEIYIFEHRAGRLQDAASITTVPNPSLRLGKHKISESKNQFFGSFEKLKYKILFLFFKNLEKFLSSIDPTKINNTSLFLKIH